MSKGKVLVDGDIIAYRAAFATQDLTKKDATAKVDELMDFIIGETVDFPFPSESDYQTYITGSTNFRFDIAKSAPYKGNRAATEKPKHLGLTRGHLLDKYSAIISVHYNFGKREWSKVTPIEGTLFFYTQILTGDNADNIKGLYGIGPKKADKLLDGCDTEESMWDVVVKAYDGDVDRVVENARLLWLRRYDNEMWEPPQVV
jgi:5'-3' exonuclease